MCAISNTSARRAPQRRPPMLPPPLRLRRRSRQASPGRSSEATVSIVTNGAPKGAAGRKLGIVFGPVLGLVMFAAVVWMASRFVNRYEYKDAYRAPVATVDVTPREAGVAAEKADAEKAAKATPYTEAEYRTFPIVGSRVAIWSLAQL